MMTPTNPYPAAAAAPRRMPDWPARLAALVSQRLAQPFVWGRADCATFVADAAVALYGTDHLAELRGTRRNRFAAMRQIKRGGGIPAALARAGLQPVAPRLAGRGDVVMLLQEDRQTLAVCNGEQAVAQGPDGLVAATMRCAVAAWRA